MVRYTIRRILLAIITAAIILTLTYFLMKLLPFSKPQGMKDPEKYAFYMKQVAQGYVLEFNVPHPELGDPLFSYATTSGTTYFYLRGPGEQYVSWVRGIFTAWNWGPSTVIQPNVDSMVIIGSRLPTSIKINIWAVLISVPAGIGLGIWAALKKNTMTDHIISTLVMVFISVPSFIVISLLMTWFAYGLHWLPSQWPLPTDALDRRISVF